RMQSWTDTHAGNAIEMPSGVLIVAETTRGKLSRITGNGEGEQRSQIGGDFVAPLGLALAGENAVYVSEMASGLVSWVDIDSGARRVIATGLDRPQGLGPDRAAS